MFSSLIVTSQRAETTFYLVSSIIAISVHPQQALNNLGALWILSTVDDIADFIGMSSIP